MSTTTMRGLSGISGFRSLSGYIPLNGIRAIEPMDDIESAQERDDERLRGWVSRVGEARAQEAWDLQQRIRGKRTLPELCAEAWLIRRGVRYQAQVNVGFARPDLVLFDVPGVQGAMVWRIQGEYWHASTAGKDAAQKTQLLGMHVDGIEIAQVIDLWEGPIYESELVFEQAIQGVSLRL